MYGGEVYGAVAYTGSSDSVVSISDGINLVLNTSEVINSNVTDQIAMSLVTSELMMVKIVDEISMSMDISDVNSFSFQWAKKVITTGVWVVKAPGEAPAWVPDTTPLAPGWVEVIP